MKQKILKYAQALILLISLPALLNSCKKDKYILDADYPATVIYLTPAALATLGGGNDIYSIAAAKPGVAARFAVDVPGAKFNIPLGIYKSGIDLSESFSATVSVSSDTVTKFIAAGKLPLGTEILPPAAYTLPGEVTVAGGNEFAIFNLAVDLNFLKANLTKKYAIAVQIASPKAEVINKKLSLAIIYFDVTTVLLPVANFAAVVDNYTKKGTFINTSTNGLSYSWNFGDATPLSTETSPVHVYTTAGTYTVTLTTTGVAGTPTVKTLNVVIP